MEKERERLGTTAHRDAAPTTTFYRGGEATVVELVSGPENPYRDMYVHAMQTWGDPYDSKLRRWDDASSEQRQEVIYDILTRQALPLALELPDFYFEVRGASRISFDQIARMRIGVTFSSEGTRDNDVADIPVMVPPRIWDNAGHLNRFKDAVEEAKDAYAVLVEGGVPWADARHLIPQGIVHRFALDINYAALANFLGKRMRFCMDFATVDVAWKMYEEVKDHYAVLAVPLRPECDLARRCTYRAEGRPGEAFSNLFRGCGRWPDPNPIAEWDVSSANPEDERKWLGRDDPLLANGAYSPDWAAAFKEDWRFFHDVNE